MRDGQATKERIARAAMRLFVEKGLAETTMRQIAKAARITEGAIYRHYESKEELSGALFTENYAEFAGELENARRSAESLRGQLAAMVQTFYVYFDADPVRFSYLLLTQHAGMKRIAAGTTTPVSLLRAIIAKAIARGDIPRQDADVATALVLGSVLQVAVSKIYGDIGAKLSSLAPQVAAACWAALNRPTPD
jgi:AcrR family transcriptional regulator